MKPPTTSTTTSGCFNIFFVTATLIATGHAMRLDPFPQSRIGRLLLFQMSPKSNSNNDDSDGVQFMHSWHDQEAISQETDDEQVPVMTHSAKHGNNRFSEDGHQTTATFTSEPLFFENTESTATAVTYPEIDNNGDIIELLPVETAALLSFEHDADISSEDDAIIEAPFDDGDNENQWTMGNHEDYATGEDDEYGYFQTPVSYRLTKHRPFHWNAKKPRKQMLFSDYRPFANDGGRTRSSSGYRVYSAAQSQSGTLALSGKPTVMNDLQRQTPDQPVRQSLQFDLSSYLNSKPQFMRNQLLKRRAVG